MFEPTASRSRPGDQRHVVSGAVVVPRLYRNDRPLVIVLHPTGHAESGSPRIGWAVVGYLQTVVLSGTDLGLPPAPVEPVTLLGVSRVLCAFLVNDLERKANLERGGWAEDPLPAYTEQRWELLQAEHERMQHHADAMLTRASEANA